MYPEIETIYFGTEFIHPPHEHIDEQLRSFFQELSRKSFCGCNYRNFSIKGAGSADFATREGKVNSICRVRPDRIHISEDWTPLLLDDFVTRAREIASSAMEVFKIPIYIIQSCTIRCLLSPSSTKDTRVFLAEKVCSLDSAQQIFPFFNNAPAQLFGVRIFFPPSPEKHYENNLRIESFSQDPSRIFTENAATYHGPPISADDLDRLGQNLADATSFLKSNTFDFLAQFDR